MAVKGPSGNNLAEPTYRWSCMESWKSTWLPPLGRETGSPYQLRPTEPPAGDMWPFGKTWCGRVPCSSRWPCSLSHLIILLTLLIPRRDLQGVRRLASYKPSLARVLARGGAEGWPQNPGSSHGSATGKLLTLDDSVNPAVPQCPLPEKGNAAACVLTWNKGGHKTLSVPPGLEVCPASPLPESRLLLPQGLHHTCCLPRL